MQFSYYDSTHTSHVTQAFALVDKQKKIYRCIQNELYEVLSANKTLQVLCSYYTDQANKGMLKNFYFTKNNSDTAYEFNLQNLKLAFLSESAFTSLLDLAEANKQVQSTGLKENEIRLIF